MSRTNIFSAAALALALAAAPQAGAQSGDGGSLQQGLVKGGAAPDAFLLYTGDVIGYLDPCG